jgi:hypothetical protein
MKIPNANHAYIDIAKLRDYSLNPEHLRGQHKARMFAAVLGLTVEDTDYLRDALLAAALSDTAETDLLDKHGQRYHIDFILEGRSGERALVRSAWIIRAGEDFPRLVTTYVIEEEA